MRYNTTPIKLISIHERIVRVHRDLFVIDSHFDPWVFGKLTDFEVMVLLLEDRRFFQHRGLDLKGVAREIVRVISGKRHGGASTIDMQFVRTVTGYRERTLSRKCYEILLSWLIQFRYGKFQILRSYLGIAFFGSGLKGAEAAADTLFNKRTDGLQLDEAAFVAAMLVYPKPLVTNDAWLRKVRRRAIYARHLFDRHKKSFEKVPAPE